MDELKSKLESVIADIFSEIEKCEDVVKKKEQHLIIKVNNTAKEEEEMRANLSNEWKQIEDEKARLKEREKSLEINESQLVVSKQAVDDEFQKLEITKNILDEKQKSITTAEEHNTKQQQTINDEKEAIKVQQQELLSNRKHWEGQVEQKDKDIHLKMIRLKELKESISSNNDDQRTQSRPTSAGLSSSITFIPPRQRKQGVTELELDVLTIRNRASHCGDEVLRLLADTTVRFIHDITVVNIRYISGSGVLPPKVQRPCFILYCGKAATGRVNLPADPHINTIYQLEVDLSSRSLSLLQNDILITRDGMWSSCSVSSHPSSFSLGVALMSPESYVELLR